MANTRKYWYVIAFFICLIIAIYSNGNTRPPGAAFYSWVFIGIWLTFTLYFWENLKRASEFNSPHNSFTFIFAPLFFGLIASFWGYFTPFWQINLFGSGILYLSAWDLVFSLPYQITGIIFLWSCFRKFEWVYVSNTALRARRFGFISTLFFIAMGLTFIFSFYSAYDSHTLLLPATHYTIDLSLVMSLSLLFCLIIYYGLIRRRPTLPPVLHSRTITPAYISSTTIHSGSQTSNRPTNGQNPNVRVVLPDGRTYLPFQKRRGESKVRYHLEQPQHVTKKQGQVQEKPRVRMVPYERLKPKAGVLTIDDFKCIFCFQLPKLPDDANRGIVLCPSCRYPAHTDEFRDWMKTSNLCSRCGHVLSSKFRQNPEIISASEYLDVIKEFNRRKKN